jgi:hypothetical protein
VDIHLEVKSAHIQSLGNNPYGSIKDGAFIVLKAAFWIPTKIELDIDHSWEEYEEENIQLVIRFERTEKPIYLEPDIALNPMSESQRKAMCDAKRMRLLVLGKDKHRQDDPYCQIYGLFLRECEGMKEVYERVGLKSYPVSLDVGGGMPANVSTFKVI